MADWNNWADTLNYKQLEREYEPHTLQELKDAVGEAATNRWKIRAVGSGHAWSNLGVPRCKGAVINMKNLNKPIKIDKPARLVEVEGGMSIEALNDLQLDIHFFAMGFYKVRIEFNCGVELSQGLFGLVLLLKLFPFAKMQVRSGILRGRFKKRGIAETQPAQKKPNRIPSALSHPCSRYATDSSIV